MKAFIRTVLMGFLAVSLSVGSNLASAEPTKVVYHIDDAATQGLKGLRNIRNHLDVSPQTKIIVVTHANGVDILMEGGKDKSGTEYAPLVAA
ncbi:MAG: hypothetical protein ACO265_07735, partial [Polynucleobacter sp.]